MINGVKQKKRSRRREEERDGNRESKQRTIKRFCPKDSL
jgi:hypothetical protein